MNSLNVPIKLKSETTARTGAANGTKINQYVCIALAPSIFAA
jgi:hypothetical protein